MQHNGRQLHFFKIMISTNAAQWETTPLFQSNDIYKFNTMGDNSNFQSNDIYKCNLTTQWEITPIFMKTISTNEILYHKGR